MGDHPYGYSPFFYDISTKFWQAKTSSQFALIVRVIAIAVGTQAQVYRNVELIGAAKTHIPVWGTFVTTPEISDEKATVRVQVDFVSGAELKTVILNLKPKSSRKSQLRQQRKLFNLEVLNQSVGILIRQIFMRQFRRLLRTEKLLMNIALFSESARFVLM